MSIYCCICGSRISDNDECFELNQNYNNECVCSDCADHLEELKSYAKSGNSLYSASRRDLCQLLNRGKSTENGINFCEHLVEKANQKFDRAQIEHARSAEIQSEKPKKSPIPSAGTDHAAIPNHEGKPAEHQQAIIREFKPAPSYDMPAYMIDHDQIVCKNCGFENSHDSMFCEKCSAQLRPQKYCRFCGGKVSMVSGYCETCKRNAINGSNRRLSGAIHSYGNTFRSSTPSDYDKNTSPQFQGSKVQTIANIHTILNKLSRRTIAYVLISITVFTSLILLLTSNKPDAGLFHSTTFVFNRVPSQEVLKTFTFLEDTAGIIITGYTDDTIQEAVIPDNVNGIPVVGIGNEAFSGWGSLASITIPQSVTWIGKLAFKDCISLTGLVIPDSVIKIGAFAFQGCSLLSDISLPSNISEIGALPFIDTPFWETKVEQAQNSGDDAVVFGDQLLYRYLGNESEVVVPSGIKNVDFSGCDVQSVILPDTIKSIGEYAFSSSSITEIAIPESVIKISEGAFSGCTALENVSIPQSILVIEDSAFEGCRNLTQIKIPNGISSIGDLAFAECMSLSVVELPDYIDFIGAKAFFLTHWLDRLNSEAVDRGEDGVVLCNGAVYISLEGVTSVIVPENVRNVDFWGSEIESVQLPENLKCIGDYSFRQCKNLRSISIPNNVESIGDWAFEGCQALESIDIPHNVRSLGFASFYDCSSLSAVTLEGGLISIGSGAFMGCPNLSDISIPDSVTSIGLPHMYMTIDDSTTIHCSENSYAHYFAKESRLRYQLQ